ncbi:MocR-like pyridoxine biosynthesis transcription factor PdxR [Verminephrobacter aporrectodeae]|uniref:PLP-dependent aminotransferase family protein n=1 Tax=Verminephrobacter aporrectodeae subsp. tuberculatae TaxID=1110392 RepID=A0ABT3KUT9_9BURK|nr:PLP-dependent aminotransferase family protein [Verminephrobacter aporrectodeae]MCW5223058.1 PLP-dependent aminotransferase family protein [Verminephrobacter aporrectodeae subsp. tuberculatae]MCW5256725.1 PLP-dependent aminotransferase family protein [Verminephrobacter aporrectodeae subsp. tuberculatae]MCW5288522.1 PLP-dependent aminotransferase family protein [Verminephrobacter aporrectodeae subsp. tuberculatae]MCW5322108.1 PLP-dependent aminotransferase family protein [Verminephrobacter apo
MPSPRSTQWAQLFSLPEQPALPLQGRLRAAVVQAILAGRLSPGAPLPSSRELANLLGLSRNTVTSAYLQLMDEGFLEARPRSGVFVAHNAQPVAAVAAEPLVDRNGQSGQPPDWSVRVLRSLVDQPTLAKPDQWRGYPYPFVYGTYDPQLFPTEDFRECCARSLARSQLLHWTPDFETDDVPDLIEQIRTRLLPKRGVFALKEEILVTVGTQHAYYLLADALFDERKYVGLEEPGHPHARNSFSLRNPKWVEVAVDGDGLVVDALPVVDYLFITPSHQSPTTATLSLERRQWLLRKAELQDFVIIEDDYEAENLYAGAPMPALKSLDKTGRVIYVGAVSKSLSPALRLGYVVAPRGLITELRAIRHAMVRHPSAFLQHAYALFLSLGHHESHARRVNAAMQERLALAAEALRSHLPDFAFRLPQGGASIWVQAPAWVDAAELALMARSHGVLIEAGDVFFVKPPYPCTFFRLRLSSIAAAQIPAGIRALGLAVEELAKARGERRMPSTCAH